MKSAKYLKHNLTQSRLIMFLKILGFYLYAFKTLLFLVPTLIQNGDLKKKEMGKLNMSPRKGQQTTTF